MVCDVVVDDIQLAWQLRRQENAQNRQQVVGELIRQLPGVAAAFLPLSSWGAGKQYS